MTRQFSRKTNRRITYWRIEWLAVLLATGIHAAVFAGLILRFPVRPGSHKPVLVFLGSLSGLISDPSEISGAHGPERQRAEDAPGLLFSGKTGRPRSAALTQAGMKKAVPVSRDGSMSRIHLKTTFFRDGEGPDQGPAEILLPERMPYRPLRFESRL
ncbi:MAG: hypothetical protein ACLFPX_06845 [Candidatus Omnitrophota bacterium]